MTNSTILVIDKPASLNVTETNATDPNPVITLETENLKDSPKTVLPVITVIFTTGLFCCIALICLNLLKKKVVQSKATQIVNEANDDLNRTERVLVPKEKGYILKVKK